MHLKKNVENLDCLIMWYTSPNASNDFDDQKHSPCEQIYKAMRWNNVEHFGFKVFKALPTHSSTTKSIFLSDILNRWFIHHT